MSTDIVRFQIVISIRKKIFVTGKNKGLASLMLHLDDCESKNRFSLMGNLLGPHKHGRGYRRTSTIFRQNSYVFKLLFQLEKNICLGGN